MWALKDARNQFSKVVEAAQAGRPQQVMKRGKPAVVVMSVTEYARLTSGQPKRVSFAEHLLAFPREVEHASVASRAVDQ